jgi:hypothetical protein
VGVFYTPPFLEKIQKRLVQEYPWVTEAVSKAYSEAKQMAYDYMSDAAWVRDSLPWIGQEFAETRALMGDNDYSYGIQPNRKTLETLFRYSHQQGLCDRELTIEELFEPGSLGLVEQKVYCTRDDRHASGVSNSVRSNFYYRCHVMIKDFRFRFKTYKI